jgi:trk system potassium uptake protein TrkH
VAALAFSFPMMLPAFVLALVFNEKQMISGIGISLAAVVLLAPPVFLSFKKKAPRIYSRDGFFAVTLTWIVITVWGALPYCFVDGINFLDALFESAGAFATTGATTISDVEALPRSLMFWRCASYWIGGMGILLLTVAFMPLLGVGGFQLVKAETTGPEKDKITPKITATAKTLWLFYCAMTFGLFLLYMLGGMNAFDAICHSFSTVSTGGISTKNDGLLYYNSPYLEVVFMLFLFFSAVNFNLYYYLLKGNLREIFYNSELRAYVLIAVVCSAIVVFDIRSFYDSFEDALRLGSFQTLAFLTTGGTAIAKYGEWPPLAQTVLFLLMFAGGCSGSTAGGIKIIRHVVVYKQAGNEIQKLLYPRGVFSIQLNGKVGRKDVVYGVAGFVFLYLFITMITALLTAASGFDIVTSISTALSVIGNIGTGFGSFAPGANYSIFAPHLKAIYIVVMLAGRLELWAMLILFKRDYWRG